MTDMSSYWLERAYILCRVLALVAFGILGMNVSSQPTIRVRYREDQTMNKENHTSTPPNLRVRHMIAARNQTWLIPGHKT